MIMREPESVTLDLDAVRAELARIADDVDKSNYQNDTGHFTSMWANLGRHVPVLLAEIKRLRTALLEEKADLIKARTELVRLKEKV